jgi:hypothetical protein
VTGGARVGERFRELDHPISIFRPCRLEHVFRNQVYRDAEGRKASATHQSAAGEDRCELIPEPAEFSAGTSSCRTAGIQQADGFAAGATKFPPVLGSAANTRRKTFRVAPRSASASALLGSRPTVFATVDSRLLTTDYRLLTTD